MKQFLLTMFLLFFLSGTALAAAININTADQKALETLPNIGATKAHAIITYRKAHTFESVNELTNVKGIGEKTFTKLKNKITVTGE